MPRLLGLVLLAVGVAGCGGDSLSDATTDLREILRDLNTVLARVKDKATAEAALPEIRELAARRREVYRRLKSMPEPRAETLRKVKSEHATKMQLLVDEATNLLARMPKEASDALRPAMKAFWAIQ